MSILMYEKQPKSKAKRKNLKEKEKNFLFDSHSVLSTIYDMPLLIWKLHYISVEYLSFCLYLIVLISVFFFLELVVTNI